MQNSVMIPHRVFTIISRVDIIHFCYNCFTVLPSSFSFLKSFNACTLSSVNDSLAISNSLSRISDLFICFLSSQLNVFSFRLSLIYSINFPNPIFCPVSQPFCRAYLFLCIKKTDKRNPFSDSRLPARRFIRLFIVLIVCWLKTK